MHIETPTLDKIKEVQPFSEKIGEFLEWLNIKGIALCTIHTHNDNCYEADDEYHGRQRICGYHQYEYSCIIDSINTLLHQFFDIDEIAEEKEKQALYDSIRIK